MDPITGGLISTGVNGISSIFSANKAYTRQKEMMQHAHQWEVDDLRRAGLNPILSATGGNGASASSPQASGTIDSDFASAAQMREQLSLNAQSTKSNIALQKTQEEKAFEEKRLTNQLRAKTEYETAAAQNYNTLLFPLEVAKKIEETEAIKRNSISSAFANYAQASSSYAAADNLSASASNLRLEGSKKERESDMWSSDFGKYIPYAKEIIDLVGGATGALKAFTK